jgi:hypothetical protein
VREGAASDAVSTPGPAVLPPPPDDRSLVALLARWWWAPALLAVMFSARIVAVAGLRAYVYVDSGEYATLDFSGRWRRPWATPLLYAAVGREPRYEVWAQAIIGAICWTLLGLAIAAWFRDRSVRIAVVAAVCLLGLTTSVTNWDTAVLSESLALSLTVLLLAGWLALARRPSTGAAVLLALATVPWLFVRQSLLPAAAMVIVAAALAAVVTWRRGGRWRPLAGLAVVLVVLTGVAAASYSRNQEIVTTNLTVIVANRIAPDPDRLAWFVGEGMPVPVGANWDPNAMEKDPEFGPWVRSEGRRTYARFLLTHPWYTLTAPLPEMVTVRKSYGDPVEPRVTMLSPADGYGTARPVIPEPVERYLFEPGATGTILAVLVGVLGWAALRWRWADRRWAVPLATIAISLASLVVGWHGATPELPRLAIVSAVALRIGLIVLAGFLAEAELAQRRARRSSAGLPRPPVAATP